MLDAVLQEKRGIFDVNPSVCIFCTKLDPTTASQNWASAHLHIILNKYLHQSGLSAASNYFDTLKSIGFKIDILTISKFQEHNTSELGRLATEKANSLNPSSDNYCHYRSLVINDHLEFSGPITLFFFYDENRNETPASFQALDLRKHVKSLAYLAKLIDFDSHSILSGNNIVIAAIKDIKKNPLFLTKFDEQLDKAIVKYNKAAREIASNPIPHVNMGLVYLAKKNTAKALSSLMHARKIAKKNKHPILPNIAKLISKITESNARYKSSHNRPANDSLNSKTSKTQLFEKLKDKSLLTYFKYKNLYMGMPISIKITLALSLTALAGYSAIFFYTYDDLI